MKTVYKIAIGIVVIIVLAFVFKPNIGKSLYNYLKKDYEQTDKNIVHKIDSIQKIRDREYLTYQDILKAREGDIERITQELDKAKLKIRHNEKLLNEYRSGNFDERFRKFTELVTNQNTLPR